MNKDYKLYVHIAPNGKRYYGITKQTINQRWRNGKGYKDNQHFTNAVNKYGWGNIEHIVIYDDLTESEAKELEQRYIQWYCTTNRKYGYNISLGGEGNNGKPHTEETKQKISEAHKGEKNSFYGKTHTKETKQKISEARKSKPLSEETKQKIKMNSANARSIICITTNKVFRSINDGANYYNTFATTITACCRGKRKSAGKSPTGEKLVWRYIDIIEL